MDSIKNSFKEALDSQFNKLKTASSECQGKIIDNINILASHYETLVKEEHDHDEKKYRLDMEKEQYDDSAVDRRDELTIQQESFEEQVKTRKWSNWISIGTTIANMTLTCILAAGMFNFEKEGSFTTCMRNGILGRVIKK